ncbi:MAG TPA: ABC transporter substrate-binding protein [Pirellulaceae bacterium]|nr:ABC transporter substrate-binding protein [Pirellulaceae bacterium]
MLLPGQQRLAQQRWLPTAALAWIAALAICHALADSRPALAQQPKRLFEQDPFDIVTLTETNESKVLKVYPLALPGRKIPEKPKASERLRIKLVEDGSEYDVAWNDIAQVELFEQMVLAEANRIVGEGKFDEAYDYFAFLLQFYPNMPGLAEGRDAYLYLAAGSAFRQRKYDEALAVLEELLARNPNYRAGENSATLLQVLGNIADPILAAYVAQADYRSARILLNRLVRQYSAADQPFAQRWRERMTEMATKHRDEAKAHLAAGRFVAAKDAAAAMVQIWPDLEGASELFAEIARTYPLVVVGVEHPAKSYDPRSLHDFAARRTGRLVERLLVEFEGPGPEGGRYSSPLAGVSTSDDGLSLSFRLPANAAASQPSAFGLAQRLVTLARPASDEFRPAWAHILQSVRTDGPRNVVADLRLPYVLPEALLQAPLAPRGAEGGSPGAASGPFVFLSQEESLGRFTANADYPFRRPGQLAEVAERYYDDPQRLLIALKQGEVDLVDRVFPGDIGVLAADSNVVVAPYAAPTTHVLAIRGGHPYLANRTFRRALLYATNRELILKQGLLRGRDVPGFRLVSGPFPASAPGLNLPGYGYDETIEPREFDPRLALTLRLLGQGEVKGAYEKQKQTVPPLTALLLGHPADETSRVACKALVKQWKTIGVDCKLVEFAPGIFDDESGKCDLVYLQLAAWEPIVDAARLLGPDGPAFAPSDFVQLTLRQLANAQNWQQGRERLLRLHRLIHEDVALLPLYQTIDHYAYRRTLQGPSQPRVTLYQDIDQWQTAPQVAEARP